MDLKEALQQWRTLSVRGGWSQTNTLWLNMLTLKGGVVDKLVMRLGALNKGSATCRFKVNTLHRAFKISFTIRQTVKMNHQTMMWCGVVYSSFCFQKKNEEVPRMKLTFWAIYCITHNHTLTILELCTLAIVTLRCIMYCMVMFNESKLQCMQHIPRIPENTTDRVS